MVGHLTRAARLPLAVLALALGAGTARTDEISTAVNPVSGALESAQTVLAEGTFQISHQEQPEGTTLALTTLLSSDPANDLDPGIDVDGQGDTSVVWWRACDPPQVLYRSRDLATGVWSDEVHVSGEGEIASRPALAHDGTGVWILYQAQAGSETELRATHIHDDPEPIPDAVTVATTSYAGDLHVELRSEQGQVWATWMEGNDAIAWSRYDPQAQAWSQAQTQRLAGASLQQARALIRALVMGS